MLIYLHVSFSVFMTCTYVFRDTFHLTAMAITHHNLVTIFYTFLHFYPIICATMITNQLTISMSFARMTNKVQWTQKFFFASFFFPLLFGNDLVMGLKEFSDQL